MRVPCVRVEGSGRETATWVKTCLASEVVSRRVLFPTPSFLRLSSQDGKSPPPPPSPTQAQGEGDKIIKFFYAKASSLPPFPLLLLLFFSRTAKCRFHHFCKTISRVLFSTFGKSRTLQVSIPVCQSKRRVVASRKKKFGVSLSDFQTTCCCTFRLGQKLKQSSIRLFFLPSPRVLLTAPFELLSFPIQPPFSVRFYPPES